ncbi:MAG: DUF3108 domain-containing protein [Elusimicrobiota bacterium]
MKRTMLFVTLFLAYSALFAQNEPCARTHKVEWGDTLAKIAVKYYGDGKQYVFLAEANGIKNPHAIICGQVVNIPPLNGKSVQAVQKVQEVQQEKTVQTVPTVPIVQEQQPVQEVQKAIEAEKPAETVQAAPEAEIPPSPPAFVWRKETNDVWSPGEKLSYSVKWQFITVGYAVMEIRGPEDIGGRQAYHIFTEARSAPFFDNFYKVRNTNESWMDVESLCSLKFATSINEGKAFKTETLLMDQENCRFTLVESNKTGQILPWVQDILSSLYYLRTKELIVGQVYSIDTHSGDLSWPLAIKVIKQEKVRVPSGEYECLLLEPAVREGAGLFQSQGRLWVWVTKDSKRVPVKMSSKIAIGSVEVVLKEMKLP